jgi:hypothetical protein
MYTVYFRQGTVAHWAVNRMSMLSQSTATGEGL